MPSPSLDAPSTTQPWLMANGIRHAYGRGEEVLGGVSLDVPKGQILGLIGRSGCGKSTLLHILAGLTRPSAGRISVNGTPVTGPSPDRVMMFQQPSLLPWMTVRQNVELGLRFTGRASQAKHRVPQVLQLVDLDGLAERNVQDLSGGQQQRVALARSLAPEPAMLLLDEPFSALDAFTRAALQRDVRQIAQKFHLTVILVTHDVGEAVLMADRAILLASAPGRVAADTALALSEDDRREGSPAYTAELARLTDLYAEAAGFGSATASME